MKSISVSELNLKLRSKEKIRLLDIREEYERDICYIPNSDFLPMGMAAKDPSGIQTEIETVVYCHHGIRSFLLIQHLEEKFGFKNLVNLNGGINQWAVEVDPAMSRY